MNEPKYQRINERVFTTPPGGSGFGDRFNYDMAGMTEGSINISGLTPKPALRMPMFARLTPDALAQLPPIEVGTVITLTKGDEDFQFRVDRIDGPGELWLWLLVDEEQG
jgi:hypothetical protein